MVTEDKSGSLAITDLSGASVSFSPVYFSAEKQDVAITISSLSAACPKGSYLKLMIDNDIYFVEGNGETTVECTVTLPANFAAGNHAVNVYSSSMATDHDLSGTLNVNISQEQSAANSWWQDYTFKTTTNDRAFKETGKAVELGIEEVRDLENQVVSSSDYTVKYYKADGFSSLANDAERTNFFADIDNLVDGTGVAPSEAKDAGEGYSSSDLEGKFVMAVFPSEGELANVTVPKYYEFSIFETAGEAAELELVSSADATDKTFVYDGSTDFFGVTSNKLDELKILVDGVSYDLYDSTQAGTSTNPKYFVDSVDYKAFSAGSSATNAGSYVLGIKYNDGTTDKDAGYVTLNVEKFDLSKATVTAVDQAIDKTVSDGSDAGAFNAVLSYSGAELMVSFQASSTTSGETVNPQNSALGLALSVDSYDPAVGSTALPGYKGLFQHQGLYGFSVSAIAENSNAEKNFVTGTAKGEVRIIADSDNIVASNTFEYDDSGNADATGNGAVNAPYVINKSEGESFDFEKIKWSGDSYDADEPNATITITDANGDVVSEPSAAGTYLVTVQLPTGVKYDKGGSGSFYVKVINGTAANAYFTVDGKPVTSSVSVNYDGEAVPFTTLVKLGDKAGTVLKEGTDYTVEIKKGDTVVDEIKDFGTYTVTVKGKGYEMPSTGYSITVVVNASEFDGVEAVVPTYGYDTDEYEVAVDDKGNALVEQAAGYAYTGEAVTPEFKLFAYDSKGEKVYFALPADAVKVAYKLDGKTISASDVVKVDDYQAVLSIDWKALEDIYGEGAGFDGTPSTTVDFSIVNTIKGGFSDVKASEWYADEATKAKQLGYMKGLSGTDMLLPNANITRADVAMVLFRMAGGEEIEGSYPTKFEDVAADAYYAQAIDWAYKAGIITGYEGTSNFGPNDLVTREQLATMLGRFAENVQGEDVSAGEIDGYTDAASVQDFAKEGMAYCVEAGIFGVNTDTLDPQGNATRAQVAAISVRVMPAEEL